MRIEPRNWVLLALVVALAGLARASREPLPSAERSAALYPHLWPQAVARIELESVSEERLLVRLVRDAAEGWVLPEASGVPAHLWSVEALLTGVRALRSADLVSEDATGAAELYGLEEGALRVRLFGGGAVLLADLVQGRALAADPRERGGAGTFVRPAGGNAVYRAAQLAPLSGEPLAWMETRLLAFESGDVRSLRLRGGELPETLLERTEDGWSAHAGGGGASAASVPAGPIEELLALLASLVLTDVAGLEPAPEMELGEGEARAVLELALEPPLVLRIGAPASEDRVWSLRLGGRPESVAVTLPRASVERVLEAARRVASRAERDR